MSAAIVCHGDAMTLPLRDNAVDAIVCDPPYGLEFMGQEWDSFGDTRQPGDANFTPGTGPFGRAKVRHGMAPSYRSKAGAGMAKTGSIVSGDGVLPSFLGGLNPKCQSCGRWQRGANPCSCEVPDFTDERLPRLHAFEDWCLAWATEVLRVAKPGAHLIAFGGTRTHHRLMAGVEDAGWEIRDMGVWLYRTGFPKSRNIGEGRGTALKPSIECWLLARAPLSERNVALNVERWGTGALNIDDCRHPFAGDVDEDEAKGKNRHADFGSGPRQNAVYGTDKRDRGVDGNYDPIGRWPANTVTLEEDEVLRHFRIADFNKAGADEKPWPKGSPVGKERCSTCGGVEYGNPPCRCETPTWERNDTTSMHPTVKPVDLMRHLVRLVTPPRGIVLDQFGGSGTTAQAALMENRRVVTVEKNADYLPLIARRLNKPMAVSLFDGS